MDQQLIKALIEALATSDLSELDYSAGGERLRLVRSVGVPAGPDAPRPAEVPAAAVVAEPSPSSAPVMTAPLYGVVHLQRSPDAPPLVAPGDAVAAGQVLCMIEAMKVFTELRAERAGSIAAVLVTSGQEVETGQPLFRLA
jgi:acetyl-CoA carboxylase biotin carboxyl carrier protein